MAGEWRDTALGDVVRLQRGHDLPDKERTLGPVPVMGSFGVTGWHDEARARGPGVTIGRSGASIGVVSFIRDDYWPLNTCLYVTDFQGNDPRFCYYWLGTLDLANYNSGSAQPSLNRNYIFGMPVRIPDVNEQRAIAHILGTLDDKIELNRRMNETLEGIARAIFKSWFVDFLPVRAKMAARTQTGDPVRAKAEGRDPGLPQPLADLFPDSFEDSELGEIPAGWEVRGLDEIARFLNGLALQKYPATANRSLPVIKIAQLRAGNAHGADRASADLDPEYVVDDGDVLFSWSGSLECVLWAGGRGALNQHLFKVTSTEFPKWFYYLWLHEHLPNFRHIAAGKATTMGHIQRHHLSDAKVVVPDQTILDAANRVLAPTLAQMNQRRVESRTLAALRDTLLPKLLSGQVHVSKYLRQMEATA